MKTFPSVGLMILSNGNCLRSNSSGGRRRRSGNSDSSSNGEEQGEVTPQREATPPPPGTGPPVVLPSPVRLPVPDLPDLPDLIQPDNVEINIVADGVQPQPQPNEPTMAEKIEDERLRYWQEKANAKAAKAKEREARISYIELKKRAIRKKYDLSDHENDDNEYN